MSKTHADYPLLIMDTRTKKHLDAVLKFAESLPNTAGDIIRKNLHDDLARLEKWTPGWRCLLYPDHGIWGDDKWATPDFGFVLYSTKDICLYPACRGQFLCDHGESMRLEEVPPGWKRMFNGGLLFHGAHDGYGSGSSPTFGVTLTPTRGWSIHT